MNLYFIYITIFIMQNITYDIKIIITILKNI